MTSHNTSQVINYAARPVPAKNPPVPACRVRRVWFWRRAILPPAVPELKQRRLTTSLSDDPVRSVAISRDGRFLAYADLEGLHVRIIDSGETRDVPQPKELAGSPVCWRVVAWFPGGTSFIANSTLPPEYTVASQCLGGFRPRGPSKNP
jgi:hypothetical protein